VKPQELKASLTGVMSFSVTPFTADHALDLDTLARHVERMSYSGVHQIAVAGAVAEYYALTFEEYRDVIRTSIAAAGGRVPVLVGIGHSTRIAVELARIADGEGASGLLINPLYLVAPGIDGMVAHHEALADVSGLGQIVFSTRASPYGPDAMARLAEVEEVVGFKDELGDLDLFLGCIERLGDRIAWINGMAEPYTSAYFAAGATCFTTGLANFAPEVPLAVYAAAWAGDFATCNRLVRERVAPFAALRKKRPGYHIAVIKEALDLLGRGVGPCRLPLLGVTPADRALVADALVGLGLLEPAAAT
jgi:5-dehydro-4-deoxyglucarate dehydratase